MGLQGGASAGDHVLVISMSAVDHQVDANSTADSNAQSGFSNQPQVPCPQSMLLAESTGDAALGLNGFGLMP